MAAQRGSRHRVEARQQARLQFDARARQLRLQRFDGKATKMRDDLAKEIVLVGKVKVETLARELRGVCDVAHRRLPVPVPKEYPRPRADYLEPPDRRRRRFGR